MPPIPTPVHWAEVIIGLSIGVVLGTLLWLIANYIQRKLDANRLQTRIDLKDYVILEARSSKCPQCGKTVFLIQPRSVDIDGLSFYVCSCEYLGVVGKKRIR